MRSSVRRTARLSKRMMSSSVGVASGVLIGGTIVDVFIECDGWFGAYSVQEYIVMRWLSGSFFCLYVAVYEAEEKSEE